MAKSPRDIQLIELKDTILSLQKTINSLNDTISSLQKSLDEKTADNEKLKEQIDYLTKKLFGRSSEKTKAPYPGQLSMFNEAENEADPNAPEPIDSGEKEVEVKSHKRKSKTKFKDKFDNLKVKKIVCDLADDKKFCEDCNSSLVKVWENFVRRELRIIPQQIYVVEYYESVYKCHACEANPELDHDYFVDARPVESLFPHSPTSESAVAFVIHNKYVMGSPLYRQEKEWLLMDVEISRATMANWVIMAADIYLRPTISFISCFLKGSFLWEMKQGSRY